MKMFINDTVGMITTDDFTTTRVNTPIILIKNKNKVSKIPYFNPIMRHYVNINRIAL
ncbi:hypothetical protein BC2926_41460 [Bacillus cereus]|nr:hypothetical protein BC2926_41460 [Bacillus cereus]